MKDLFVCLAEKNRSPAAVGIAKQLAYKKGLKNYQSECVGILGMRASKEAFEKYDRIFVMDNDIRLELIKEYDVLESKIVDLDIEDVSEGRTMDMIREELEEKLIEYFT